MPFPVAAAIMGGAALAGSIGNWLTGTSNQQKQNEFNAAEAQKQRDWAAQQNERNNYFSSAEARAGRNWQSEQNKLVRQWEEDIYNRYSSPKAMMRQYRDAGLNPYLAMSGNLGSGMSGSAPMAGPTTVGSPSSMSGVSASASGQPIGLNLDVAGIARSLAESENQSAQATSSFMQSAIDVYKNLGKDAYEQFVKTFAPILTKGNPANSLISRQLNAEIHNQEIQTAVADYGLMLTKKFGAEERATAIAEANQRISESVARLQVSKDLSQAQIAKIASDVVVNAAQAFKLRREGEKFVADTQTVNALRAYVVKVAKAEAQLQSNAAYVSDVDLESKESLFGWLTSRKGKESIAKSEAIPMQRNSNVFFNYLDKALTDWISIGFGAYMNASGKGGSKIAPIGFNSYPNRE